MAPGCGRGICCHLPRKRLLVCILLLLAGTLCTIGIVTSGYSRIPHEFQVHTQIAEMQTHLKFLESLYRARQEDIINLEHKIGTTSINVSQRPTVNDNQNTNNPDVTTLLNNSDTMLSLGVRSKELASMKTVFVFQLLPHLMNDPASLRPAFHMNGNRGFVKNVIGIPTVKRDKESYLMTSLTHLIDGLNEEDLDDTLIVIFVGETDINFVLKTAKDIQEKFPEHVKSGLIELLSPTAAYYPDFDTIPLTLGDSAKRVKWRTKQNLDTLYLMAYGQSRGTYYLMLEDDVIAKKSFMKEIKHYTAVTSVSVPNWFYIEYCNIGGIGKLFKSADLVHFITYVQLFYYNMPIDWLLESYLADRVCTIDKTSATCGKNKLLIRPRYKESLFQHIGFFSSLKGKIQKVKDHTFAGVLPNHFPHKNPPARVVKTDIEVHSDYYIGNAYNGETFFWGVNPKAGALIEFWFEKPTDVIGYTFRTGNGLHPTDKLKDAVVEIFPHETREFIVIDSFDEFGLADGVIKREYSPLDAIRIRVMKSMTHWLVLSEIDLKTTNKTAEE
ncbi:alpha-1,3-mannosyl-glycoprotein 4-beta-N-acetylglucosaminyltransferase A [Pieris rapae]|uniref:alpha-1,3-mannosyl-glycoprotein 4-beta-N-acetylglucosaminyltransferase A n=1 Tax=Pieris rapae TaxID=64459 RepID=UPI001E27B2E8|nr:alpha-1,3-mannosyl-glycoprotein 4-beta-N-acetylglucosaminyltransferase A [Pieris rapae]XP_022129571.2 alpha-1,3-mannosyl-glycoprotein 4-beta-N-acetylglucosaminyltransferase A [Pieris rapae]XP_022129572.2 alpha-1,3-mannosyl-glycoprotein 4-beta-N-acetylglucosaminyltransferase A [Pieris rapae]XP_022129573.2 alpha-1,3-mannosyl-glycoprotein 4-beta-N-acetylglucosaminyltransferase A [Pieris rapae]